MRERERERDLGGWGEQHLALHVYFVSVLLFLLFFIMGKTNACFCTCFIYSCVSMLTWWCLFLYFVLCSASPKKFICVLCYIMVFMSSIKLKLYVSVKTSDMPRFNQVFWVNQAHADKVPTNDDSILDMPALSFENQLSETLTLMHSDFHFLHTHACGNISAEVILPGQHLTKRLLLRLAEYNPTGDCRLIGENEIKDNVTLMSTPTRKSSRLTGLCQTGEDENTRRQLLQQTRDWKDLLRRDVVVDYYFKAHLWCDDQSIFLDEPEYSNTMNSQITIPRGAPRDFCIHYTIVDYD